MSQDDCICENHFIDTVARDQSGQFIVKLPFKSDNHKFKGTSIIARKCLSRMETKFKNDLSLQAEYIKFMHEYKSLNHMKFLGYLSDSNLPEYNDSYFIPHHGIFQNGKLRVVFNASSRSFQGVSLNDILYKGPSLQANINDVLIKWRTFKFVYSADIAKMYRQILVHPDHRKYQLILWRDDPSDPISIFELCTVTYGVASSAYQALRCIKHLAQISDKSIACQCVNENAYVDDYLFGADTIEKAVQLSTLLYDFLIAGGFQLRKWTANHKDLLEHIPSDWLADPSEKSQILCKEHKLLGLLWQPEPDMLMFSHEFKCTTEALTK